MGIAIGIGLSPSFTGGVLYDPDAAALFSRFTTPPTDARKALINSLIVSLKTAGVWSKLDVLKIRAAADSQAARRNWIADTFNDTAVASPTFTVDRGYTGDGVAAYLESSFDPTTAAGKFALNNATLFTWELTNIAATTVSIGANSGAGREFIIPRTSTSGIIVNLNDSAAASLVGSITDSRGLTIAIRDGATSRKIRKNNAQLEATAEASSTMTASSFTTFKRGTAFSTRQVAVEGWGSALTNAESDALYNAVNTYLTAVGAV
jgi:hypothetical protein